LALFQSLIFPSALVLEELSSKLSGSLAEYYAVASGKTVSTDSFQTYISNRMVMCLTQAAVPGLVIAVIVFLYLFAGGFVAIVTVGLKYASAWLIRGKVPVVKYGGFTSKTYSASVQEMIRLKILHSYEIARNPRYSLAIAAVPLVDKSRNMSSFSINH